VLCTTIQHKSGERFDAGELPLFADKTMQAFGGAITYARRYAWASALGICDEEDDDGNQASTSAATSGRQTKVAPPATSEDVAASTRSGGGAGTPPPQTSVYTDADIDDLVKVAEERGGNPEKVRTAANTARDQNKLDTWLPNAHKFWTAKPVATEFAKRAADAIAGRAA
jgi:hypothetical protein